MKYRYLTLILPILISLSLIGVGFSAWTISGLEEESFDVSITADKVINSKEYVYLDTTKGDNSSGIDCFKYYEYGYLDSEGYLTDTGVITTYYVLDLKKCAGLLGSDSDSIELTLKLQFADYIITDLNLFQYQSSTDPNGYQNINISCGYDDQYKTTYSSLFTMNASKVDDSSKHYSNKVTFNNILKNYDSTTSPQYIYFKIEYSMFATTGTYFYQKIYEYFYKDMSNTPEFKIDIYVSGV